MSDGLYDLRSARDLFGKAQRDAAALQNEQTDDTLFNLLCTLKHLRDWICPGGHASYVGRSPSLWTPAEKFHDALHHDPSYNVVRDLCNNAKHFTDSGIGAKTSTIDGFIAGLSQCGDSLGGKGDRSIFGYEKNLFTFLLEGSGVVSGKGAG